MTTPHRTSAHDACSDLVVLAERLAVGEPSPRTFLRALGREGAGIRSGPLGVLDLARGGRNRLRGRGFRAAYDDGTGGQVRHFCGVARAVSLIGSGAARWLMERSGDDVASADGRLTEVAIVLVHELGAGRLAVADVAGWIDRRVCRQH